MTIHIWEVPIYDILLCVDVFLFVFHIWSWIPLFISEAIRVRSVGEDQSCFGNIYIYKFPCSVLIDFPCFFVFFLFSFFLSKTKTRKKKIWATQDNAACILWFFFLSVHLLCSVFSFLGMLWWTAVNLYSSCKLIVRKLYRFLYFGRKVFFSVIKDFLSWQCFPVHLVLFFIQLRCFCSWYIRYS